ncbi:MAG: urease accessory protein UreD [Pseudomonadota bacterium]
MNISEMHAVQQLQRVNGAGELTVKKVGELTRIDKLYQLGSAKIRFPKPTSRSLEAVLINTAGGLTGGDRISWRAVAGNECELKLTTQASEKVYKSTGGIATANIELSAGRNASLSWLPQDTILFDKSAIRRNIEVDLDASAHCLIIEPLTFGRKAMGERVRNCLLHDSWNVRAGGSLVHSERFKLDGDATALLESNAIAGGANAMATILFIGPNATSRLQEVRDCILPLDAITGASAIQIGQTGKLLARIVAEDGYSLRKALAPLIRLLNGKAGLPKIWAT